MAGFLKRIFSFGRDDKAETAPRDDAPPVEASPSPEASEAAPAEPVAAEPVAAEPAPRQDDPPEAGMVERGRGTVAERPLDASRGPEPGPLPGTPEPDAEAGAARAYEADDPGEGLDPSRSPVAPSHSVGGTADRHAEDDAVALEEAGEPPVDGGTTEAGVAEPSTDGADGTEPTHRDAGEGGPERPASAAPASAAPAPGSPPAAPPKPPRGGRFSTAGLFEERDAPPAPAPAPEPEAEAAGFLARLRRGLGRSSQELTRSITAVFRGRRLDDDTLEELEDVLLRADLGVATSTRIVERLAEGRHGREVDEDEIRRVLAAEVARVLEPVAEPLELDLDHRPHVILVVGVNGTGKTTTIGKLAAKLRRGGLDVMLAAGDTFRAAAIEQLHLWGERVGAEVVSSKLGADAAGLAFSAYERAREAGADVLLIDTAGRLQNRAELMDELAKVVRVLRKHDPSAPHTVLQTLDATTGQNALAQVEAFRDTAGVGGLVMTKLDGTARGGVLVAVAARFGLPVWFVGVGEGVDDLEPFRAGEFAAAIAGSEMGTA